MHACVDTCAYSHMDTLLQVKVESDDDRDDDDEQDDAPSKDASAVHRDAVKQVHIHTCVCVY